VNIDTLHWNPHPLGYYEGRVGPAIRFRVLLDCDEDACHWLLLDGPDLALRHRNMGEAMAQAHRLLTAEQLHLPPAKMAV
jgi:hypothetical protein